MLIRPAMTSMVPAAGSQLNLNCVSHRVARAVGDVETRPVEEVGERLLGQEVHDGGDVGDREDHDDHEVRRVGPQHVGRGCRSTGRSALTGRRSRSTVADAAGRRRRAASASRCASVDLGRRPRRLRRSSTSAGCHTRTQQDQRAGGQQRGDDVGRAARRCSWRSRTGPRRRRAPASEGRQPGLAHAAPAVDDEDQDQRHDERQDRRLPADHRRRGCAARSRRRAGGRR